MAAPPRWAWGVPPVVAEVDCGGARHRVTWRWGRFVLDDHDLGAEAVLEALGGEPAGCTAVLDAWRAAVAADRDRVGYRRRDPDLPAQLEPALEAARLARRLRAWRAGRLEAPALHRLHRHLLDELRASLGTAARPAQVLPGGPRLNLALHPIGPADEPALEVDVGPGRVDVGAWLAPTWLAEVASRGLSRQACGLVVEVLDIDRPGEAALVTLLRWPSEGGLAGTPSVATVPVRRHGGLWEVAEDEAPSARERGRARPRRPGIWTRVRSR